MKTRADFQGDTGLPTSIKQLVVEQVGYGSYMGKTDNPFETESLDSMMKKVYSHIELESLRLYHSNESWAIRQYICEYILKEQIPNEKNMAVASDLSRPVVQWQGESYDPLAKVRLKLEVSGRKRGYIREVMRVGNWFVADAGRKKRYTEDEVLQFVRKLATRYDKRDENGKVIVEGRDTSTFCTKISNFKRFLDLLPED